ncbi:MAG: hypothetical protein HZA67_14230 [Rhodospirillales bacterium]|nr:hypothetical protein [Rhodospirillales bacterium]
MYVVRIIQEGCEPDYKAFTNINDAKRRFLKGILDPEEMTRSALFNAPYTNDPRSAINKVKEGSIDDVYLLDKDRWDEFIKMAGDLLAEKGII